jgi:hypothetical protein
VAPTSRPISFTKLHRIHAGAQATRVQFGAPLGMTWRGEGGDPKAKEAVAHRLATCWNVLEGVPTAALLDGVLRDIFDAIERGNMETARMLVGRFDREVDRTDGRLHDCAGCLGIATDTDDTDDITDGDSP